MYVLIKTSFKVYIRFMILPLLIKYKNIKCIRFISFYAKALPVIRYTSILLCNLLSKLTSVNLTNCTLSGCAWLNPRDSCAV